MSGDVMFLVCDMIDDPVHEDGPNGKKFTGRSLRGNRKPLARAGVVAVA